MTSDIVRRWVETLDLTEHPEGGYFRETYRSSQQVRRGEDPRTALTNIYFLLAAGQCSRWHVVASDEAWHFYEGAPLELTTYDPSTEVLQRTVLGPTPSPEERREEAAHRRAHVVPAAYWQTACSLGEFSLIGCSVAPGFDFADFRFVADLPHHEAAFAGPLAGLEPWL